MAAQSDNNRRAVIFDGPPDWCLPALRLLHRLGFEIWNVDEYGRSRSRPWIEAIQSGWLHQAYFRSVAPCETWAIKQAMYLSEGFRNGALYRAMFTLADDENAWCIASKIAASEYSRFFQIAHHTRLRAGAAPARTWVLSWRTARAATTLAREGLASGIDYRACKIVGAGPCSRWVTEVVRWLWDICSTLRCVFVVLRHVIATVGIQPTPCVQARCGIYLGSPWLLKFRGPRRYDFLLNIDHISNEATVFINGFPLPDGFAEGEQSRGHTFIAIDQPFTLTSAKPVKRSVLRASLLCLALCIVNRKSYMRSAARILAGQCLRWGSLLEQCRLDVCVYTNLEDPQQLAANMFMKSQGVAMVSYAMAMGATNLYWKDDGSYDRLNALWLHCNPEHAILYSDLMVASHREHIQFVKHYHAFGSPFASLIKTTAPDTLLKELGIERQKFATVLAAFDTTYIDDPGSISNYDDAFGFYGSLLRLSEERGDLVILIKPSKPRRFLFAETAALSEVGFKVKAVLRKLDARDNVVFLPDSTDPVSVITAADKVVTSGFSTPTADAIAAGKAALWYDPIGSHHGYSLDELGLVLRSYDDLVRFVADPAVRPADISDPKLREIIGPGPDVGGLAKIRELISGLSKRSGDAYIQRRALHERGPSAREFISEG